MKCSTFARSVRDYISQELSQESAVKMIRHMSKCESCRDLYNNQLKTYNFLQSMSSTENSLFISSRSDIMKNIDKTRYNKSFSNKLRFFMKKNSFRYAFGSVLAASLMFITLFSINHFKLTNIFPNKSPNKTTVSPSPNNDDKNPTKPPSNDNHSAWEAYKAVLQNKAEFFSTDNKKNLYLNDFLTNKELYGAILKAAHFTVLDMDGDKIPEVVVELTVGDQPEFFEVLHYADGKVCGYNIVYRGLKVLKADGTFNYSSGASDNGCGKLSFQSNGYKIDTLAYSKSSQVNGALSIAYFINNKTVTKDSFDSFMNEQSVKKDVVWYEFSDKNIETELSSNQDNSQKTQDELYNNEKLGFSFTIPGSWKGKYTIKETFDGIRVYFKPSKLTNSDIDGAGFLFGILKSSSVNADTFDTVGQPRTFTANGVEYIVGGPTDVNFSDSNPEFNVFQSLTKQVKDVIKTIKVINNGNQQTSENQEKFFGQWIIKKALPNGSVSTYSSEDIKNIIGKNLSFSKEKATCFGDEANYLNNTAINPQYTKLVISKNDFETSYRTTFDKLGIKSDSITQVTAKDSKGYQCIFFIKDDNTLILYGGGIFLQLDKIQ